MLYLRVVLEFAKDTFGKNKERPTLLMSFSLDFITLSDLCQAYRKAKCEAFKDTNCAHGLKYADFEKRLEFNLAILLRKLVAPRATWFNDIRVLGRATCIAKAVVPAESNGSHFRLTDPLADWRRVHAEESAEAEFRPVIDATVEFQIISALWILKAGHAYDACLDSRVAVGNRLRRWRASEDEPTGSVGNINEQSHSLFQPYYAAFGKWREGGLKVMKEELALERHIVAVTMDLRKFYHQVDPSFLLHPSFLRSAGIVLNADQRKLTTHLIHAIKTWNKRAERLSGTEQFGLPVGLTASSVIANVILKEFDTGIQALRPAYYGRYVDDVFLVLRHSGFTDGSHLMKWMAKKLGAFASCSIEDGSPILRLTFPYGAKSELLFMGKKQKVFQLQGQHGLDLINPIEEQIRRQKSEHRGVPDLPDREAEMAARTLLVSSDATLDADALRKADAVSIRRAGFAMLLSAVEQHAHHVDAKSWRKVRLQFYGLAERHLLTPVGFFDYERYIPRILGVMIACRDRRRASSYIRQLSQLLDLIAETCEFPRLEFTECCAALAGRLIEAVIQAPPVERGKLQVLPLIRDIQVRFAPKMPAIRKERTISIRAKMLFLADWSRRSYGATWIEGKVNIAGQIHRPDKAAIRQFIDFRSLRQFRKAASVRHPFHWPALAFPTRRISVSDLTCYAPGLIRDYGALASAVRVLRGTWVTPLSGLRVSGGSDGVPETVYVPSRVRNPLRATVTNFQTELEEWSSAVKGKPVHSLPRYRRVNRLINQILAQTPRPAYILLPECSLPRRWARNIAYKLSLKGISLIAGLEYSHGEFGIRNEALVSLPSNFLGYSTNVAILQPKLAAAWGERREISKISGLALDSGSSRSFKLPVYVHGDFCFAVLICSDLTTLVNRNLLQGHVDCVFVPEWNQDLETFGSLVESTTNELHAYLVQANNRLYGDGRMRAPYKDGFKRDIVRVRGGLHDYFVTDEIDVAGLREFQANDVPPVGKDARFKPFPVGYKRSEARGGVVQPKLS